MTWWQMLLALVFTAPWIYLFIMGVVLQPLVQNSQYKKDYIKYNLFFALFIQEYI